MLLAVTDADFAAMLGGEPVRPGLVPAPGGVDEPHVIAHVRRLAADLRRGGYDGGQWMMVAGDEIVGLCGYKQAPSLDGEVEIGYGVAAARRRRGHASAAVAAIVEAATLDPAVRTIVAATDVANVASQRTLMRNGFERFGTRSEPDGSRVILWRVRCERRDQ